MVRAIDAAGVHATDVNRRNATLDDVGSRVDAIASDQAVVDGVRMIAGITRLVLF